MPPVTLSEIIRRCGLRGALTLLTARRRLAWFLPRRSTIRVEPLPFPIHFRTISSDKYVIAEVLLSEQYRCLANQRNVRVVIDVGANIGTASLFFLNQFPECRVIACEPDPGNFALLQENLQPYGPRATALPVALWPRRARLSISRGNFRDGAEWSTQVVDAGDPDAPRVDGWPLAEILATAGSDRIDILKIDIEGAERFVLDAAFGNLLPRVKTLAIELHDAESARAFDDVTRGRGGRVTRVGEVTVWTADEA